MTKIHFSAIGPRGERIMVDVDSIESFTADTKNGVMIYIKGCGVVMMHSQALPGLLNALSEYRRLNDIRLMEHQS